MHHLIKAALWSSALIATTGMVTAQSDHIQNLSNLPFEQNRPTEETAQTLMEELIFRRATQTYLWAMPLLNTMGMRDGAAEAFGTGYSGPSGWMPRQRSRRRIRT